MPKIALLLTIPIVLLMWILPTEYFQGAAMGWIENTLGRQEIKEWGYNQPAWHNDYKSILLDKYKVYIFHSGEGSFISLKKSRYYEGYNLTMKKMLIKKYGKDIFLECEKEAAERVDQRNKILKSSPSPE